MAAVRRLPGVVGGLARNRGLSLGLLALLGLLLGYGAFRLLWGEPKVGIIRIPDTFISAESARDVGEMLTYARDNPSVRAVVFRFSSPGGAVAPSEELFLQMVRLRERKPVVMAVDGMAASGGYLTAVAASYIFTKPTSFIGNVGAILTFPEEQPPDPNVVTTGPFKGTGGTRDTYTAILERVKESFLDTVYTQRGDRLKISRAELAGGRVYLGMEAVQMGLVDEIGSEVKAIAKAASLAGLRHYGLVDVSYEVTKLRIARERELIPPDTSPEEEARLKGLAPLQDSPGASPVDLQHPQIYYLYVVPRER